MYRVARLREEARRELFRETAQRMRVHEAIIEKDFWVCWVLDYIFEKSLWKDKFIFKGGTSLSKAYNAIERFSEDIDLIVDTGLLGISEDDLSESRSRSQQDKFNVDVNKRCAEFLQNTFLPVCLNDLTGLAVTENFDVHIDQNNQQNILIRYPKSFSLDAIKPEIILEIGPLAAWTPNAVREISSYAAQQFPGQFSKSISSIPTVTIERTLWEKATILHQEAHRLDNGRFPRRYSRHYYDLFCLSRLKAKDTALQDLGLLESVVEHKKKYYYAAWADYDAAMPGTFRLLPQDGHLKELQKDYLNMHPMFFGNVPEFEEIINGLRNLETEINQLVPR
ncbi:MAG: nucleotidyl transferase AbiEii/AbiGii toxin family protein [Dehalogenimonas sp.]|uniref:Nucleotidyl transferase AbiEii/AbiGii toxin family protein n=1 Tax=Candidatus Dehalogenimonas loeffleri TaxID=3127115 RepID=A0ABZ2J3B9_9CHLR|nr:nucleotidyl transferase AbiEii/AbiGii toxin family protein [Dehalogenimonas sp.]